MGMPEMRVLIAGGGTGGHLYPGIAIAEEVMRRPAGQVLFVGTARGLESKLVPAAGFPLELLEVSGLNRVGLVRMLRGLLRLPKAFFGARRLLARFRPDLVIGVGGYASGPVVFTAALLGYPTAIQEQNSHPGFTNRVLGRFVRRVFVAFEDAGQFFASGKLRLVGNPIRRRFLETAAGAATGPAAAASHPATVLVVGGSQGARAVNDLVVGAASTLHAEGRLPRLVHQTGPTDEGRVRELYARAGLTDLVEVRPFIDDMPATLAAASLVVGRAGALTLAELAMVGRPAILIPLPTAADDHQSRNAESFARAGAAVVAAQGHTSPAELARTIGELMADPGRRAAMASAMTTLSRPRAAAEIVDELERLTGTAPPASGPSAGVAA